MRALAVAAAFTAPLGSFVHELHVTPDGAAWVRQGEDRLVRVAADGRVRAVELTTPVGPPAVGGDGQLWFSDGGGGLLRVDANGNRTWPREPGVSDIETARSFVAGPDGALWTLLDGRRPRLARYTLDGGYSETPFSPPACEEYASPGFVRASDGAVWVADWLCDGALMRIAPTGDATAVPLPKPGVSVNGLAADAAGGVWFSARDPLGGHATATGEVTLLPETPSPRVLEPSDVSVAPDGRPWFTTGRCTLLRVDERGGIERRPAPIPAEQLDFDPSGELWLASRTRVARADAAGACDQRGPKLGYAWTGARRTVRVTVDEPSALEVGVTLVPGGKGEKRLRELRRTFTLHKRGSVQVRLPPRWRLSRGDEVSLSLLGSDRDGNSSSRFGTFRVKR